MENQEKLMNFTNIILNQAEKESKNTQNELAQRRKRELEEARVRAEKEANKKVLDMTVKIQRKENEILSKAQIAARNKVMQHREGIESRVFDIARTKINRFVESENYYPWLIDTARAQIVLLADAADLVLYINSKDKALKDSLSRELGVSVEVLSDDKDILGGVIVKSETRRMECSDTLAGRLDSVRSEFLNISGLKLN